MRDFLSGAYTSVSQLERAIREFIDAHNQEPKPFIWRKSADDILASIARFADLTNKIHASPIRSMLLINNRFSVTGD